MTGFFDIVLSFPTVLFSIALVVASLYWLMVVIGAADLEIIDGLDGLFEGLDGAMDGAGEAIGEAAGEAVGEAAGEAVAEAAGEGAAEGAAQGLLGFAPFVMLANLLRLGRVPLTLSLTFFILGGFATSYVLTWLFVHFPDSLPQAAFMAAATLASLVGAFSTSNLASRPFEPIFQLAKGRENASLVGETCELSTGRVDAGFGQATAQVEGDDLLFQVRCDAPNGLRRGDRMLIVSFDRRRHAFVVEPLAASESLRDRTLSPPATTHKDV